MIEVIGVSKPKRDRGLKAIFKPKKRKSKSEKEFDSLFQAECEKLRKEINVHIKSRL